MKIVHLCLGAFFSDGYAYQENMLPKFHKKLGYDVEVIASLVIFDKNGKVTLMDHAKEYINEHGFLVKRLDYKKPYKIYERLRRYNGLAEALEQATPDILFIHNCQFADIDVVAKYLKKHPEINVYVDNHVDDLNSATNWLSKNVLHKIIWKHCAHTINPYVKKFFGVLPARVAFLSEMYGLPADKCDLLVMGVDDDQVNRTIESNIGHKIRDKYRAANDDVLIMSGGKLNRYRPEVLNLLEAVNELNNPKIKVLFFGLVDEQYKSRFDALVATGNIIDVGWLSVPQTYDYMSASDLLVFPGLHSVLWEQAVGMGKPCIFRKLEGFDHVDRGGNCLLLDDVSKDGIKKALLHVLHNNQLEEMTKRAKAVSNSFSYTEIAKQAIEVE